MTGYHPKVEATDRNYLNLKAALFVIDRHLPARGRGFKNPAEAFEWTFNLKVCSDIGSVSLFVFQHEGARIDVRQEIRLMRERLA